MDRGSRAHAVGSFLVVVIPFRRMLSDVALESLSTTSSPRLLGGTGVSVRRRLTPRVPWDACRGGMQVEVAARSGCTGIGCVVAVAVRREVGGLSVVTCFGVTGGSQAVAVWCCICGSVGPVFGLVLGGWRVGVRLLGWGLG